LFHCRSLPLFAGDRRVFTDFTGPPAPACPTLDPIAARSTPDLFRESFWWASAPYSFRHLDIQEKKVWRGFADRLHCLEAVRAFRGNLDFRMFLKQVS
jgi:hypothetical protein